jgi:hypothetical protein
MSDKDLLVVISEMLRKQDQQAEILKETSETLKEFVDISIKQFEEQHSFNEKQNEFNEYFKTKLEKQDDFNERFLSQFNKQNEFNERFLNKLDEISKKP